MFRVGQKVICVDVGPTPGLGNVSEEAGPLLEEGRIYIVRWVGENPYEPWRVYGTCLRVEGIERRQDKDPDWSDFPFRATRFRPIVERKTDISIFTEMLTPTPQRVRETTEG